MMGLWNQAGSTFNKVVRSRGSSEAEEKPPSDTEPDDTSILFVVLSIAKPCLSLISSTNTEMRTKDQLSHL